MEIFDYFSEIHKPDGYPLSKRLEQALESYLRDLPANTLLLPERTLALRIGVNRHTLGKALQLFVKKGWIERSKRGTVVHFPDSEPKGSANEHDDLQWLDELHPFIYPGKIHPPVKVLLYENIPSQKDFWLRSADMFSKITGRKVEILWLPKNCDTQNSLVEYVTRCKCDVVQIGSHQFPSFPEINNMLSCLPQTIVSLMHRPEYRYTEFFSDSIGSNARIAKKVLPVHSQFWVDIFHPGLADKYRIDLPACESGKYQLEQLWKDCARKFSEGIYFSSNFVTLEVCSPSSRPVPVTPAKAKEFYHDFYTLLSLGSPHGRRLFLEDSRKPFQALNRDIFRAFHTGNLFRLFGHSTSMDALRNSKLFSLPAKPQISMVLLKREMPVAYAGLGIMKDSENQKIAEEFLGFLLSEERQKDAAQTMFSAPFHKKADAILAERLHLPTSTITDNLNLLRNYDPIADVLASWYGNRAEVDAILDGKMQVDHAVATTLENLRKDHMELFRRATKQPIEETAHA